MVSKRNVTTNNRELYNKLNMLMFTTDIAIKDVTSRQISKIINNVNKYEKIIDVEKVGEYFILRKKSTPNFRVYFNNINNK